MYNLRETNDAINDVTALAIYMIDEFKNDIAALNFLENYDSAIQSLRRFPYRFRGISIETMGYEIRLKPYDTYNIFFVVNENKNEIVIIRVLKDLQDWKSIVFQYVND